MVLESLNSSIAVRFKYHWHMTFTPPTMCIICVLKWNLKIITLTALHESVQSIVSTHNSNYMRHTLMNSKVNSSSSFQSLWVSISSFCYILLTKATTVQCMKALKGRICIFYCSFSYRNTSILDTWQFATGYHICHASPFLVHLQSAGLYSGSKTVAWPQILPNQPHELVSNIHRFLRPQVLKNKLLQWWYCHYNYACVIGFY